AVSHRAARPLHPGHPRLKITPAIARAFEHADNFKRRKILQAVHGQLERARYLALHAQAPGGQLHDWPGHVAADKKCSMGVIQELKISSGASKSSGRTDRKIISLFGRSAPLAARRPATALRDRKK